MREVKLKGVEVGQVGHIDLHTVPVSLDREMILNELNSHVNPFPLNNERATQHN